MGTHTIETKRGCYENPKERLHLKTGQINNRRVTLQERAFESAKAVQADLKKKGIPLVIISSYRSCAEQAKIYNSGVRPCAKPGTSYHNIGLATDNYIQPRWYNEVRHAYHEHGWNDFDPVNDSGHFTYHVTG